MHISYLGRDFVHFETRVNVNKRLLNGGMEKLVKTSSIKCLINYFLFFFLIRIHDILLFIAL